MVGFMESLQFFLHNILNNDLIIFDRKIFLGPKIVKIIFKSEL